MSEPEHSCPQLRSVSQEACRQYCVNDSDVGNVPSWIKNVASDYFALRSAASRGAEVKGRTHPFLIATTSAPGSAYELLHIKDRPWPLLVLFHQGNAMFSLVDVSGSPMFSLVKENEGDGIPDYLLSLENLNLLKRHGANLLITEENLPMALHLWLILSPKNTIKLRVFSSESSDGLKKFENRDLLLYSAKEDEPFNSKDIWWIGTAADLASTPSSDLRLVERQITAMMPLPAELLPMPMPMPMAGAIPPPMPLM